MSTKARQLSTPHSLPATSANSRIRACQNWREASEHLSWSKLILQTRIIHYLKQNKLKHTHKSFLFVTDCISISSYTLVLSLGGLLKLSWLTGQKWHWLDFWGWGVKSNTASAGLSLSRHGALCRCHLKRHGCPTATIRGRPPRGRPPRGRDAAEAPAVPGPGIWVLLAQTLEWKSLRDDSNPVYHLNAMSGKPPKSQLHGWAISKFLSHRNWEIINDHCCFKLR